LIIDTRAVGQEIQDQVLAAARKGQKQVNRTVRNVAATAQQIRPQLPSMPVVNLAALPTPAQLRERAPEFIAKLPSASQFRVGAEEFAVQFRSVQRQVVDQVRTVATPLAKQAAAALASAGVPAGKVFPALLDQDGAEKAGKPTAKARPNKATPAAKAKPTKPAAGRTSASATAKKSKSTTHVK
jgi:hypothetical protein